MKCTQVSLAVLAFALATPAYAQDAQQAGDAAGQEDQQRTGGIREIVVTAQKRAEDVQDVPIAISAFDAESLQERAIGNVSSLSAITPNVTLDASTPFSGSSAVLGATIRGIGSSDFAFNIDPAVGVYLDGVYLGRSIGANQDLLDVERIEVLKGPQGTLFGRNTIGGAISIVTRNPGDEFRVTGDVTTGSFKRMQVRGMVELPITTGLSSSLAFGMMKRDGYQKRKEYPGFVGDYTSWEQFPAAGYQNADRQGGDDTWSARGKLRWDDGGAFRATLTGDFTNIDQESTANTVLDVLDDNPAAFFSGLFNTCISSTAAEIGAAGLTFVCGPRNGSGGYNTIEGLASRNVDADPLNDIAPYDDRWVNDDIDTSYATGNNFSKLEQGGVALDLEYDVSPDVMLKSISSFRKIDFAAGVDLDNSPLPILQTSFTVDQEQWSQELQVTGSFLDDALNFVLGGYVFNEKGDLRDFVTFAGGLLQVDGPGEIDTTAYAAFGQVDWRLSDLIGVTFGGRYTKEDKSYIGAQSDLNGINYKLAGCMDLDPQTGNPSAACAAALGFPIPSEPFRYYPTEPNDQSFDNFSFKAGVQLYPTEDIMFYGSFSQGYKTGGWTTRLSNPLMVAPTFGEEEAETWEAGVKSTLIDRLLQLNLAAFSTKYEGIQLNFQEGVSPTVKNAGNARIKGFEIEAQAAPSDIFTVNASIGYVDAYYTSVDGPAQVDPNPLQLGVFAGASLPKAPDWKINISPRLEVPFGAGSLIVLADWTHTTSMRNDTEGTRLLMRPSTDIVNASVTYQPDLAGWNLTVGGTNLTDERYLVTGQAQIGGGVIYGTYSRPAEWYARLGFEF
ncbi:iron complex outermembrane receptor protein [Altererythrobacter atlanticus]|uniref:Pesticin receptor n=1 Tax=Croceibacterium atlanticum TaxID=1267766 RepID=A0A0F7KSM1_9SPHN|nr:TonB-dependent receptor [Croceibacterium atlanticum]AKH42584.1 Pesticin receptor precursor [Croceibacterium atlanticum]MBB5731361.1 iron complex outermembrane receptor protein [Croceibacterium atlanticum]